MCDAIRKESSFNFRCLYVSQKKITNSSRKPRKSSKHWRFSHTSSSKSSGITQRTGPSHTPQTGRHVSPQAMLKMFRKIVLMYQSKPKFVRRNDLNNSHEWQRGIYLWRCCLRNSTFLSHEVCNCILTAGKAILSASGNQLQGLSKSEISYNMMNSSSSTALHETTQNSARCL